MPSEVLSHIFDVTYARPCGLDQWMGHGICHDSKRHRDLSIRDTGSRILLYDFTGWPLSSVCAALGIRVTDLFHNASPHSFSHSTPKWNHSDRLKTAFRLDLHGVTLMDRANTVLQAVSTLDTSQWSDADLDTNLNDVAQAYSDQERARLLFAMADNLRLRAYQRERTNEFV